MQLCKKFEKKNLWSAFFFATAIKPFCFLLTSTQEFSLQMVHLIQIKNRNPALPFFNSTSLISASLFTPLTLCHSSIQLLLMQTQHFHLKSIQLAKHGAALM